MDSDYWEDVRQLYKERYGISPKYVDLMADSEVLRLCATGLSNKSIARALNIDPKEVLEIIPKYSLAKKFCGWSDDIDFNPLAIYLNCSTNTFNEFFTKVYQVSCSKYEERFIKVMYRVCKSYDELDRKLDRHWR